MEAMKQELKDHDRRITALEAHRENDLKITNENNKNLATIIVELKNLTNSMDTLANNWKEAINRSNTRQKEREEDTDKRISQLEKTVEKLSGKLENEAKLLDDKVDERTIGKNSKNYDSVKSTIVAVILTAIGTTLINAFINLILK